MSSKRQRGASGPLQRTRTINPYRVFKKSSGRKSRNALVNVPRNKLAFPQSMSTKLRYVDSIDLAPTSSTAVGHSFLANGMYDPDTATGGHQPRGFDQYTELYRKFTVKSSKISVTFSYEGYMGAAAGDATGKPSLGIYAKNANDFPAPPAAICLIHKSVETNATGTIETFQERDRTKWKTIVPTSDARTVSTGLRSSEFFGKDFLVGADGYTGTDSADPTNKLYYHVMVGLQTNEYPSQFKLRANVCIEYDVVWTEPKQLTAS